MKPQIIWSIYGILLVLSSHIPQITGNLLKYQAEFRSLGPVSTGTAVAHIQMPLNLADILEAYSKIYVTLEKAKEYAIQANVSAESETLLQEVENSILNIQTSFSQFVTQIRTFIPGLKLPRGNIVHTLARNYVPEPDKSKLEGLKHPPRYLSHNSNKEGFDKSLNAYYIHQGGQIQNTTKPREKRQLGLAVMTLVNLGLTLYTTSQLTQIHEGLSKLNDITHLLGTQVQENSNRLNLVIKDARIIHYQVASIIEKGQLLETRIIVESTLRTTIHVADRIIQETSDYNTGLSFLSLGKLHPTLLNTTAVSAAFEDVSRQAAKRGFRPLTPDPMIIFDSKVSLYAEEGRMLESAQILIHLPLIEGSVSNLYQFLGNPILSEDPSGNAVMVHFRPTTPYLLLDEKQDTAVELPEAEFAQCKQYPSVLYCPTVTIMTKNPQNSCLGALFLDSEPRQHCHMVFGKASEVIQAISPGNYMITSVEEIQIATHYFSSPQVKYEKLQRGTHVLKLSEDVKMVTTPSAIIKNHYSFTAAELTLSRNFTFSIKTLFNDSLNFKKFSDSWAKHFDFTAVREIDVDSFHNKLKTLETEYQLTQQITIISILWKSAAVILLIAAAYLIIQKLRKSNCLRSNNPQDIGEFLESADRHEMVEFFRNSPNRSANIAHAEYDPTQYSPRLETRRQSSPLPSPPPQFRNPQNEQNRNNANLNQTLRSRSPGRITLRSRSPGRALDSRTLPNPFVTDTPQNKPRNRITRL